MPATFTPRDERNATRYAQVRDRSTLFGHSDDAAMRVMCAVLDEIGDEVGRMAGTSEIGWSVRVNDHRIGHHTALSALETLSAWGFVANLGMDRGGRYIYARTTKSVRTLEFEREHSFMRIMQARERRDQNRQEVA